MMKEIQIIKESIKEIDINDTINLWIKENTPKEIIYEQVQNFYIATNVLNRADHIFYDSNPYNLPISDHLFQGFNGQILSFKMNDNTIKNIKGPWYSNALSLYEKTGIDLKNESVTMGFLFITINNSIINEYKDIIYCDECPIIGKFKRLEELAREYSQKYKRTIYFYIKGASGSILSQIEYK